MGLTKAAVLALGHVALLVSALAFAEPRPPMIQVGLGVEAGTERDVEALVALSFNGFQVVPGVGIYIARLRGEAAFVPSSSLSYFDIEFIPVVLGYPDSDGRVPGVTGFEIHALPIHATRNVAIDRDLSVRVTAVGVQARMPLSLSQRNRLVAFAKIAVDALGFKSAAYVSAHRETFRGFSVGSAALELGLAAGTVDGKIRVSVAFGAGGDLSFNLSGVQADTRVYGELVANFTEFFYLFARAAYHASSATDAARTCFRVSRSFCLS